MKWFAIFLFMASVYVSHQAGSIYDEPQEKQIDVLKPLLLKLLQPKPRPIVQIHQLLRVHIEKCCSSVPVKACCPSSATCCASGIDMCCKK